MSTESVVVDTIPDETVPAETVPAETVPTETVPAETVPTESVPTNTVPAETVPTDTVPAETVPTESVPTNTVPAETVPTETVPVLPTLTLADILSSRDVLLQQEADDKRNIESFGQFGLEDLRTKLVAWALTGFTNNYSIRTLSVTAPPVCSDGVVRGLSDYIEFCSGKPLIAHLADLQKMLPDIQVGFTLVGSVIHLVVLRSN